MTRNNNQERMQAQSGTCSTYTAWDVPVFQHRHSNTAFIYLFSWVPAPNAAWKPGKELINCQVDWKSTLITFKATAGTSAAPPSLENY